MYLHHFGLSARPFELTDDPAFYYSQPHEIASISLLYAIEQRQGLAMLTGEPGTGKTTLLKRLLHGLDSNLMGILLSDAAAAGGSLLAQFARGLRIKAVPDEIPTALRLFLERERACGRRIVLMLDEAQTLTRRHLAEVHFLSNLDSRGMRLVQVFLVGQPTLDGKLAQPELAALSQRIAVRTSVERLGLEQTAHYINFRLTAGGCRHHELFTTEAARRVHEHAHGIPRLINIVCERALLVAYADGEHSIGSATVEAAVADLRLQRGMSGPLSAVGNRHDAPSSRLTVRERIDRLEEKLDLLIMTMARAGFIRAELAQSQEMKRWLESLLFPPVEPRDTSAAERQRDRSVPHPDNAAVQVPPRAWFGRENPVSDFEQA